jgi:hypothetical protein
MTAQNDLDRALGTWFAAEVSPAPPEPLARVIESTRTIRPRPALTARVGSHWVGAGSTDGPMGGLARLRPVMVAALVALLAVALVGAAVLVGSRPVTPKPPPRTYVDELVPAADLSLPMAHPSLVPLLDGRVLVIGDDGDGGGTGTRALVYDPATGVSEATGPLVSSESLWVEAAVRLTDGRVLVVGNGEAQVFDPSTRRFVPAGPMITPRSFAGVVALPDGGALIAGGHPTGMDDEASAAAMDSAELFDPETLTFSPTGSMGTSRSMPSMAVLPDGRVFVSPGESRTSVETYDPSTGTFSAAGTMSSYGYGDAIALPDGRVAVFGGMSLSNRGFMEVWDPTSLSFSPRRDLAGLVRSATLLDDGRILLQGDKLIGPRTVIYDPTTERTGRVLLSQAWWPRATRLADGRVLLIGGVADGRTDHGEGGTTAPGVPTVEIFQ